MAEPGSPIGAMLTLGPWGIVLGSTPGIAVGVVRGAVAHRDCAASLALWRRRLRVKTTIRRDDGTGRPSPDRPLSTSQPIWPKR